MKIELQVPGPDDSGYLRRIRSRLVLKQIPNDTPESVDALIDWILNYVVSDHDEAREILLDCSKVEFDEIMDTITSVGEVSKKIEGDSLDGSEGE